ncbi:hypothetical protein D9603_19290 [Pseudoalteromonas sp. PS5]|nr:hypothetical protein D9603_19290 [Pseudoalteromonas sp. PS5]
MLNKLTLFPYLLPTSEKETIDMLDQYTRRFMATTINDISCYLSVLKRVVEERQVSKYIDNNYNHHILDDRERSPAPYIFVKTMTICVMLTLTIRGYRRMMTGLKGCFVHIRLGLILAKECLIVSGKLRFHL